MKLVGRWAEIVQKEASDKDVGLKLAPIVPLDLRRASRDVRFCRNEADASALVRDFQSVPLSALALSIQFDGRERELALRSGERWRDMRSLRPVAVGVAAWAVGGEILPAVLSCEDGRCPPLSDLLRMRVPLIVHDAKPALFAWWSTGFDPDLAMLYDTRVTAACLRLGRDHRRGHPDDEIGAHVELAREHERLLSLAGQCEAHGLAIPPRAHSSTPDAAALAAQADAVLRLYAAQQGLIVGTGIATHLYSVEFPFVGANARIEWHGVHVERNRLAKVRRVCAQVADQAASELADAGVTPPGSREAFMRVMRREGLEAHFVRDGVPRLDDDTLGEAASLHPAVTAFRRYRYYTGLATAEWTAGALIGADGRLHPEHRQLGAATGRNACRTPNFTNLSKALRPVVTAPPDRALVELDYSQIEIGVAAAEHADAALIEAYNSGDVYAAVAQRFYEADLTPEERAQDPLMFRRTRSDLRDRIKVFVLATLYGAKPRTLAEKLKVSEAEAKREMTRLLASYPTLARGLEECAEFGLVRGEARLITGLRRELREGPRGWVENALRNTPVQGGAAVVFKRAVVELDRAFRGTDTWIVMQMYDSVLIECPRTELDNVAEQARRVMFDAVRAYYPSLRPRIGVNKTHPGCWNKDGHADSLDLFLADPNYRVGSKPQARSPEELDSFTREVVDLFDGEPVEPRRNERSAPFHTELKERLRCFHCGGTNWWRLRSGGPRVCERCHPCPYGDESVDRWSESAA